MRRYTWMMVMEYSGMSIQPHKAIVGANAFAHESGIHQDGMLKNKLTYEIIAPETIGIKRAESDVGVVMGKHSGRHALKTKLAALGYSMEAAELDEVFVRFKLVAEQKTGWGGAQAESPGLQATSLFFSKFGLEVYVGSVGHGVQWDTVNEYHVVPVHHAICEYTTIHCTPLQW